MKHEHHIIENHNGVRVRTNKTISLTLKEHADIHKKYFEQWGFKEDYLAWQGLSGQLPKEKIIHEIAVEMGKRNAHHMHTKQARKKMAMTKLGSKLSEEHKRAIAKGRLGQKQPQSQKDKVRKARQLDYIITYKNKTFEITNLLQFCRKRKLDQGNMTKVAQKKLNSYKGYIVAYK